MPDGKQIDVSEWQELEDTDDEQTATAGKDARAAGQRTSMSKEVRQLMYAFGDVEEPDDDAAKLCEQLVSEYIVSLGRRCLEYGKKPGRIATIDILFALRHDARKFSRVKELMTNYEAVKEAKSIKDKAVDSELAALSAAQATTAVQNDDNAVSAHVSKSKSSVDSVPNSGNAVAGERKRKRKHEAMTPAADIASTSPVLSP